MASIYIHPKHSKFTAFARKEGGGHCALEIQAGDTQIVIFMPIGHETSVETISKSLNEIFSSQSVKEAAE